MASKGAPVGGAAFDPDAFMNQRDEQKSPGARLWDSFVAALPHPLDAIREWASRPAEVGKAMDALSTLNQLDAEAAKDPRNQGKPRSQWIIRDPTPDEQAAISVGMNARLHTPEGDLLSEGSAPAVKAGQQAWSGDVAGGAGTLLGAYVAPTAVGATIGKIPAGAKATAKAAADFATKPGNLRIATGATQALGGTGAMLSGNPAGVAGGGLAVMRGIENIAKGIGERSATSIDPVLDDIAKGLGGKDYASLGSEGKATVDKIAVQLKAGNDKPVSTYTPAPASPNRVPINAGPDPITEDAGRPRTIQEVLQQELEKRRGSALIKPGEIPDAPNSPGLRAPLRPPLAAPDTAGSQPQLPESPVGISAVKVLPFKAEPGALSGPAYASAGRATKAQVVAQALKDAGITHDQLSSVPPSQIQPFLSETVKQLGLNKTGAFSPASLSETLFELKKLERAASAAAVDRLRKAGVLGDAQQLQQMLTQQ